MKILIIILLVIGYTQASFADSTILDNIADGYKQASISWFNPLFNMAQKLFFLLATIEIAWTCIIWVLEKDELTSFTVALIKKIISIGFFYALLLNANIWLPAIIDSFISAGQQAGGVTDLSPSAILDVGLKTTWTMLKSLHFSGIADTIATGGTAIFASIIIIFSFAVIASQLLIALIESYIVISGGVLFLGFGGSRWTTEFTQKYISYAFAIGVKLFILYLLIGIGQAQATIWPSTLEPVNISSVLSVMGSSLVYMFLVWQIPSMAASMLSGAPNMTAGSAMSAVASSGAMMVGTGMLMGGMGVGSMKNGAGMAGAAKAAWDIAGMTNNTQSGGGFGNTMKQMGGAMKNFTSSGIVDSVAGFSHGLNQTKGGRMSGIMAENLATSTPHPNASMRSTKENNEPVANNYASSSNFSSDNNRSNNSNNKQSPSFSQQFAPTTQAGIGNKTLPPSIGKSLENMAKNTSTQIPHDTAPIQAVNIKLNYTGD